MNEKYPDISIVVLNWNTSDLLNGVLDSIVATASDLSFDVTVIDNASTDGGLARVEEKFKNDTRFSFVQNEKNVGWVAINSMLECTRGKYIATIDPDAILHQQVLQSLLAFMESHPEAGAATASLFNTDGTPQLYYRRIMTPTLYFFTTIVGRIIDKYILGLRYWKQYRYDDLDITHISEVEQPAWPCLMWRREAVGAYIVDKRLPFYFVDVDMSKRLYDSGYKIFLISEASVTHLKSTSFSRANSVWRQHEFHRSILVYFKKHYLYLFPILWLSIWSDRLLRALLARVIGREPLR